MHRTQLSELAPALSGPQRVLLETSRDAGVGSWLTAEPLASCGFVLNKSAFRDAVAIRYGWPLDELPSSCVCGAAMTLDHAAVCPTGGYPSLRHNEIRDLLAEVFSAVISDVRIEPTLLPLTGTALGSLLIALTDVHNQTSYDLVITMIAANNTPEVVTLYNQMLSSTYHPSAIPAGLATTQVIVAVFAVGSTTPLNVYIKDESEVTQNNLLAMMKDSRNYMMQGMVARSAASPTRPLTAQTTWKVAGTPTPTAHYRIFNADCYGSSPPDTCTRPTYTAISMNASSLTFLTYGVYEVVFQVTTGSGPTAKTKYITPPLRLTVNTGIILGQTPVCPLPTTDSPMVNVPCTCEDGFSWNSTRCATVGSHLIAAGVPTGTNGTIVLHNILGTADRPKVTFLNNQIINAHLTPSQVTSSTNFVANMMVGMTSYAAVLYSMSPALAREGKLPLLSFWQCVRRLSGYRFKAARVNMQWPGSTDLQMWGLTTGTTLKSHCSGPRRKRHT
ncbi:uncharacterized protein LOC135829322 [Sycon ciliatum]|uniref:uncharacterized protein LOC135829322 n=1 Tax=Sycon ciliatum TaxID=27933 RepID=UPI0031F6E137